MSGISRAKDASIERSSWVSALTVGDGDRAGARTEPRLRPETSGSDASAFDDGSSRR